MDLSAFLNVQFLSVAITFARIGGAMMFLPGFGEQFITVRHRLAGALLLSAALTPVVGGAALPETPLELIRVFAIEITIGVWIGLCGRVLLAAVQVAGAQIGMVSGLANAFAPNMGSFEGATIIASALLMAAIAVIFAADIHHLMIASLMHSYDIFPVGVLMTGDMGQQMAKAAMASFSIGVSMSAPFYVIGIVLNTGLGLTNRMLPTLPVFFVASPVLIVAGLFVLVLSVPSALRTFVSRFTEWLGVLTF
ncbi:flagellar biosynthetic protein FliR [Pseudooceanicola sp. C21-150M6]|uniref:flagellar biosynthetic protein FliR n=1 Tax=Pseudooceanicola sp. C21-150M6 TaxID=3434355 RepID=UPI003D7FC8BE